MAQKNYFQPKHKRRHTHTLERVFRVKSGAPPVLLRAIYVIRMILKNRQNFHTQIYNKYRGLSISSRLDSTRICVAFLGPRRKLNIPFVSAHHDKLNNCKTSIKWKKSVDCVEIGGVWARTRARTFHHFSWFCRLSFSGRYCYYCLLFCYSNYFGCLEFPLYSEKTTAKIEMAFRKMNTHSCDTTIWETSKNINKKTTHTHTTK